MNQIDFHSIVQSAWHAYDDSRDIKSITDISAMVSTNHVYRIRFADKTFIIAKLSYFGKYEHFVEDHTIINALSNNLPAPFDNTLSRSLFKGDRLFVHREQSELFDVWVIFYRPIAVKHKLPKRLDEDLIIKFGREMAHFHKACTIIRNTLPPSSKSMRSDIEELLAQVNSTSTYYEHGGNKKEVEEHCNQFLKFYNQSDHSAIPIIPVFVDWNIGNFSVTGHIKLYSRWDYDWFRMSSRMMDFYFLSRVVSDIGDRTVFTYNIDILREDRFITFLQSYHSVFPLTEQEIDMLPEMYRFFLLNYVVKYGHFFFHAIYANKLKMEVFKDHLPSIASFQTDKLKKALGL